MSRVYEISSSSIKNSDRFYNMNRAPTRITIYSHNHYNSYAMFEVLRKLFFIKDLNLKWIAIYIYMYRFNRLFFEIKFHAVKNKRKALLSHVFNCPSSSQFQ